MTQRQQPGPLQDYGYFGPDSVTRKVWGHITTPVIAIQRAVVIEELDPNLIAAVDATQANYDRPRTRYDRTVAYFATVALGDSERVAKLADVLVKVHSKAIGIEPVSGNRYDANNPDSQLWILLTGWHSVLTAYETYGPGRLTPDEENRYWEECAIAAEFQTCDPRDVPRTSAGVADYFEQWRPRLAVSEAARRMMDHLLDMQIVLGDVPAPLRPAVATLNATVRAGTIATMPKWMRELSGFDQPRTVDVAVRPILRSAFATLGSSRHLQAALMKRLAPSSVAVTIPHIMGIVPLSDEVITPAEGRRRYGFARPAEAHRALRARQYERVFGAGAKPSDEGLVESQAYLGAL